MIKKVAIITIKDGYANSVRPKEIKYFLENQGLEVELIDTLYSTRMSDDKNNILHKFPNLNYPYVLIFIIGFLIYIQRNKNFAITRKYTQAYLYIWLMKLKAYALKPVIEKGEYDLLICESPMDSYVLTKNLTVKSLNDCPSPWVDELYFSGEISQKGRDQLRSIELQTYSQCDYLAFHWYLYSNYVKKNIYNGNNIIELNWGCVPKNIKDIALYNEKARIIFLGYLGGDWVNLPLLSRLSKLYNIDVYGGPPPNKKWGLNYKGYAPSTDVIKNYQFGLITISKDKLRSSSFSSKHLEYISYGLPVLTPEWRKDKFLQDVSIYYNEENFLDIIRKYSKEKLWEQMKNRAYNKSKEMTWGKVLKPLDIIK